jgi:hypothetical protein
MFQYTKENILNKVETGKTFKVEGGKLIVDGLGEYVLANIVDGKIFRTACEPGSEGTLTIDTSKITGAGEYVLTFRVVTSQALAEFASPNWNVFGKPMIVGYNATTLAGVKEAIELAIPEGNKFITVEVSGSNLILKGATPYITFDKVAISTIDAEGKETVVPVEFVSEAAEGKTVNYVKNVEPFATKEWIVENLRFPTYPNIRYASASTMPTADLYTEFSFDYTVAREGLGGLSGVGQALAATTRHIVYVPATVAGEFRTKLATAFTAEKIDGNVVIDEPDVDESEE